MAGSPFQTQYGGAAPVDAQGRPLRPDFVSIGDPSTGLLQDQYLQKSQLNTQGMDALRSEALREGPSKWRQLAESQASNAMAKQGAGSLAQAQNQLAMSGGLRSGARERLASQTALGGLTGRQNIYSQLAMQDETNRQGALKALPGQELQQAGYLSGIDANNIGRTQQELTQKRMSDAGAYSDAMKGWAAEQMANSVQTPGGLAGGIGGALSGMFGGGGAAANPLNPSAFLGNAAGAPAWLQTAANPVAGAVGGIGNAIGIGGGK